MENNYNSYNEDLNKIKELKEDLEKKAKFDLMFKSNAESDLNDLFFLYHKTKKTYTSLIEDKLSEKDDFCFLDVFININDSENMISYPLFTLSDKKINDYKIYKPEKEYDELIKQNYIYKDGIFVSDEVPENIL